MPATWTDADTERARRIWAQYQKQHDVSDRRGQAVGIDPASGRIWFGKSGMDIWKQMDAAGDHALVYLLRVGYDYYVRKGGHR